MYMIACGEYGYDSTIGSLLWARRSTTISNVLFQNSKGCEACYQVTFVPKILDSYSLYL